MKPTPGDILAVYNPRLDAYTAVQVTALKAEGKSEVAAVLALDWVGPALPDAAAVATMAPANFNFFFWKDHRVHVWVSAEVPRGYTLVGHRPPLVVEDVKSYSGWPSGSATYSQRRWEAIPQAERDLFKQMDANRDKSVVLKLGDREVLRSTQRLDTDRLAAAPNLAVFEVLPILTSVNADAPIPGLFDFIRRRPFVYESDVRAHGERVVDLRGANLTRLTLEVTGVHELHLNEGLEHLSLMGQASPELKIHAEADGRWLTLSVNNPAMAWSGLDALDGLHVHAAQEVDVAGIVRRFPKLTELRIWGAPGYLRNTSALAALPELRMLTLCDMFGITPDEFPGPERFAHLGMLWLTSIPAELAAEVKKTYKTAAREGLDLSVRQPRKAEWLAENLDNPFRIWDGADTISPTQAKKAATLYRQARSAALKAASEEPSAAALVSALTPIVTTYTEGFNKMDARKTFIYTEEREHIYVALMGIFDAVDEKLRSQGGASAEPLNREALVSVLDSIRDF
ncbi:gliding motility protein [Myxococcus llanfairpwllgwyngyllgogerychwyrndrobwllllantysiliogogogochensis]|uniref:Gliding motility protein n=1 Tax=Myxococcus llanfairpwllgwyngyllgogerychwyrndrobwllllantysiliogogogochensis TaxID=2590453 RepID=A0A540WXZ9_9BACT|nr:gliding motility protein [Myxococcus llanfairpwllgwyngyllgogerychwyrndrobwllllantysiliogogogochensis]TQF13304.1 gliding motility protein [Myxococcus llanfairpwllgwyngyllgogerychwyrndrobwllllantysiliogogogochensis]